MKKTMGPLKAVAVVFAFLLLRGLVVAISLAPVLLLGWLVWRCGS